MMFKVFLAVACFIVADARRLNRFFWDDDSDFDLSKRSDTNDLCVPDTTDGHYDVYFKIGIYHELADQLPKVTTCKLRKAKGLPSLGGKHIKCKPEVRKLTKKGGKVKIGCKAVLE